MLIDINYIALNQSLKLDSLSTSGCNTFFISYMGLISAKKKLISDKSDKREVSAALR